MVKCLRFDKLSTEAQEKARDAYRSELNYALDRKVLIVIGDRMKAEGIGSLEDVNFSLNECEGDGIAFYGELDIEEFLKKSKYASKFKMSEYDFNTRFEISKNAFIIIVPEKDTIYHNRNTMLIKSGGVSIDFLLAIRDCLEAVIKDLEKECYQIMDNEDQVLRELVDCCEFDENGEEI